MYMFVHLFRIKLNKNATCDPLKAKSWVKYMSFYINMLKEYDSVFVDDKTAYIILPLWECFKFWLTLNVGTYFILC